MSLPPPLKAEVRLILLGVAHELLQLAGLASLVGRRASGARLVGRTVLSAAGGPLRIVARDPSNPGRYVVQQSDGTLFTLARRTILQRLRSP